MESATTRVSNCVVSLATGQSANGKALTQQLKRNFGNATVCEVHDESQANNGEPNHRYGNSNAPLVKGEPNQRTWRMRCSETRDVSGFSMAVASLNSCADQLRYSVQGRISLVLTLRQLSREMQSRGGARISISS